MGTWRGLRLGQATGVDCGEVYAIDRWVGVTFCVLDECVQESHACRIDLVGSVLLSSLDELGNVQLLLHDGHLSLCWEAMAKE
jgi:hypothetical protein